MMKFKKDVQSVIGAFLFCLYFLFIPQANARAETQEKADFPSLVSALTLDKPLEFCDELVPLQNQDIRERFEKAMMLALWNRPQVILWLKRSTRYLPHVEKMLKEAGLPDDLKFITVAESALRPHARSSKGAIGFWQIMSGTGRKYGLKINRRVDERRNIFASTKAVIPYFKDLYKSFGTWTLATAAFNRGENGVMKEVLTQETKDFYRLYLPLETQQYIPRILAIKLILTDPERYGFRLKEEDYYPLLSFDTVEFKCKREMPIQIVARAANANFKDIKNLNPDIRGYHLASGKHRLMVPEGASEGFDERYKRLEKKYLTSDTKTVYVVKKGDNLSNIADRFEVPLAALLIWNRLDLKRPIHPGETLIIYPNDKTLQKMRKAN